MRHPNYENKKCGPLSLVPESRGCGTVSAASNRDTLSSLFYRASCYTHNGYISIPKARGGRARAHRKHARAYNNIATAQLKTKKEA